MSSQDGKSWKLKPFVPHPLLSNQHLMTIVPGFLPRKLRKFIKTGSSRLFAVDPEATLLAHCHFQDDSRRAHTLIVLHGLEGSSESSHVRGIGAKAYAKGFNVVRLNMRNCGGSMKHARTLYNAGMWQDLHAVMDILNRQNGLETFLLAGYSLGGNLILNAASRLEETPNYELKAVCAVSPAVDLATAVEAIEQPENRIYQDWFLRSLKQKILAKSKQFPEVYKLDSLESILSIREFDDCFTAPHGGYGTAARYYAEASSITKIKHIKQQALIITAEDDPLVPVQSFRKLEGASPHLEMLITKHGGHGGFFQSQAESEAGYDHFWAENRVVDYIQEVSRKRELF